MKKKLSMLAALALCTTIGGAYATWVYSTDNIPSGYGVSNLGIAGVDYLGNAGSISVVGTNTEIKIDDPTNGRDYLTKMVFDPAGYFTVTFTPSETASETVKDGMDIQWYVGLSSGSAPMELSAFTYTYGTETPQQIFLDIDSEKVLVQQSDMNGDTPVITKVGNSYTFKISMADVIGKLTLNETIKLNSEEKYTAYLNALKNGFIHVHAEVVLDT